MNIKTEPTFEEQIENAPDGLKGIANLVRLSTSYDAKIGTPLQVFLDLIGYSAENYGESLVKNPADFMRASELGFLAEALAEYSDRPSYADTFIEKLLAAEE